MSRRSFLSATVVPTATEDPAELLPDKSIDNFSQATSSVSVNPAIDNQVPDATVFDNQTPANSTTTQSLAASPHTVKLLPTNHGAHSITQSTVVQKASGFKLTKNYRALVASFKRMQPFSRNPDGKYSPETICVLCMAVKPTSVLFPCQHMCVCNNCIISNDMSPDYPMNFERCICPVCRTDIRLILPHTGDEEEKYWNWVLTTKSALPSEFKKNFKKAGKKLSEDSIARFKISTVGSLSSHLSSDATTPTQHPTRPYRRSSWTPTIAKRGSAYKLSSSKKQESCLIL